jgi:hypothetical protein
MCGAYNNRTGHSGRIKEAQELPMANPPTDARLGRRLFVLRVAGAGAAVTVSGVAAEAAPVHPTVPGATNPDVLPVITDNDPRDQPGYGRGGYYRGTGRTDNDPRDSPGYGRGGYYAPPPPRYGDPRGYGYGRSVTDNDPNDGPGRGRGWR